MLCEVLMLAATLYLDSREALTLKHIGLLFLGKWLLVFAGQWTLFQLAVRRLRGVYSPVELRGLFRSSWPIMLAALAFVAPLNSGTLLVRWFDSLENAGVYGVAFQVANAYYLFGGLGVQVVQPHILGEYGLEATFVRKLAIFVVAFVSSGGLLAVLAGWTLVHLFLDASYHPATTPMALLLICAGGMLASRFAHPYLVRFGAERAILVIHVGGAGLFVAASLLFSGTLTPTATAAIAAGASVLSAALCFAVVRSRIRRANQKAHQGVNKFFQ
jgi:O-antigen/teichoic acid export membrane protein